MFDTQVTRALLLLLISTFSLSINSISGQPNYNYCDCPGPGTDSDNANYIENVTTLLRSLSSKASSCSFYNSTLKQIYSLYLCRHDVDTATCQTCVETASQEIQNRCQSYKTAIIWYEECMVRYSNLNFFGIVQTTPRVLMWNAQNTSSREEPKWEAATGMISQLVSNSPYAENMFNTSEQKSGDGGFRYGLAQCSQDLSREECRNCLTQMSVNVSECCYGRRGWRVMSPSCYIRYEDYKFYNRNTLASSLPPPLPPPAAQVPSPALTAFQGLVNIDQCQSTWPDK